MKPEKPFKFYTRLHLSELTGLRAYSLGQMVKLLKEVPGSSIYHHTHRFLQQHQYLSPEPPNDFAYWITEVLGEDSLGEKLASVDIIQFSSIRSLREVFIAKIQDYLNDKPVVRLNFCRKGEEFHFIKCVSFILPTKYSARNLKEFADVLRKITIDSIYYHIFESRLRLEKKTNDFSAWIEDSVGNKRLAVVIAQLDPYTRTLEDLRKTLIEIIEKNI